MSDHQIAAEVLAASYGGRQSFSEAEPKTLIVTGQPAEIARDLIMLGFPDRNEVAETMFERSAASEWPVVQRSWLLPVKSLPYVRMVKIVGRSDDILIIRRADVFPDKI